MAETDRCSESFLRRLFHAEVRSGKTPDLAEKRSIITSIFIAMLLGIAYSEAIPPIRESIRSSGLTLSTVLLGLTFFFVSMRFFIGNQLHLLSKSVIETRGDVWLFDLLVITFETVMLCFLGGLAAIHINRRVSIDFVDILIALYIIDIAWVLSQKLLGVLIKCWERKFIPWAWALLNSVLVGAILLLQACGCDLYESRALAGLFALNVAGFVVDILLIDHYDLV